MPVAATIVIPTLNRPSLLATAVESALEQTLGDHEVVVVDDGSVEPVKLAHHPRLRVVRLGVNRGGSVARNVGLAEAAGHWITYLDDDDLLLPHHLEVALDALGRTDLPSPVATLSGVEIVGADGKPVERRFPPTLARGALFSLEEEQIGASFSTKATLVAPCDVLRAIGGFDEAFRSRVHTELFLRLNPVCSLLGLTVVTYRRRRHGGPQVSKDPLQRRASMTQLEVKHRELFARRSGRHAELVFHQAFKLWLAGQRGPALATWARALRLHPRRTAQRTGVALQNRWEHARQR